MRWLKWSGVGLLVVVLVLAALWTWSRLRGPTPEQRAALELLEAPNAFEGRNAFDAIWVLAYDVPAAKFASVADEDMRVLADATREPDALLSFTSAAARHPALAPARSVVGSCSFSGATCLGKVSAAFDDYASLVQENRKLIERVEALSVYSHFESRLPYDYRVPFPHMTLLTWPVTAHAVQFARGEQLSAIEATCRDLATMRRIGANSDLLLVQSVGTSLATGGYGALLADMLTKLPRGVALPASCEVALAAPTVQEASVCPAMRGEFAWITGAAIATPEIYPSGGWSWLVFDPRNFRVLMAERIAEPCARDAEVLQRDEPFIASGTQRPAWQQFDCVANSAGCGFADVGPAYVRYGNRTLDHRARLQLLGTLAWLRDQPDDGTLAERLARRPAALRSPARDITVTADGRSLEIAQYDTSSGATWSLPLPAYLVESTAAPD